MDRAIMIALIGLGLYAFFALVDFIKTRNNVKKRHLEQFKDLTEMLKDIEGK